MHLRCLWHLRWVDVCWLSWSVQTAVPVLGGICSRFSTVRALEIDVVSVVADESKVGFVPPPIAAVFVAASRVC
jgi:hypothetical protein